MQRDLEYVLDILEAGKLATSFIKDKSLEQFLNDTQCQDAVIRRLMMIGEAAGRVSDYTKEKYSELPWKQMIGMRNFLVHEYGDVDLNIVRETSNRNLPFLIKQIEKILSASKNGIR
jgi:uncharacterized protein with HEPN domain